MIKKILKITGIIIWLLELIHADIRIKKNIPTLKNYKNEKTIIFNFNIFL